jgi:hypothetical protein
MSTSDNDIDFQYWSKLAQENPQAFEEQRARLIHGFIDSAPEELQKRLQGLQWRIDCVRSQAKTPMASCLRISSMMWDSVLGENGLAESLQQLANAGSEWQPPMPRSNAAILNFTGSYKKMD